MAEKPRNWKWCHGIPYFSCQPSGATGRAACSSTQAASSSRRPKRTSSRRFGRRLETAERCGRSGCCILADREPLGPYQPTVPASRVRHVRLNDLIDPQPLPLGVDDGIVIESNAPIVVQFTRLDSSQPIAIASTLGFAVR